MTPSPGAVAVDLRAGGGTGPVSIHQEHGTGRSPRGRRNRLGSYALGALIRSISARAEEPAIHGPSLRTRGVDLRAGGGTERAQRVYQRFKGRSPRGRRNHLLRLSHPGHEGSISARAEEPRWF